MVSGAYAKSDAFGNTAALFIPFGGASKATKAVSAVDDVARAGPLENMITQYTIKSIPRAPKGGIEIAGKFYKGGQFIPGKRTTIQYGRGAVPKFNTVPALSTPLRPTPMNFEAYSPQVRRWLGWGGAGLGFIYGTKKIQEKQKK
jgi:hypothetical protein